MWRDCRANFCLIHPWSIYFNSCLVVFQIFIALQVTAKTFIWIISASKDLCNTFALILEGRFTILHCHCFCHIVRILNIALFTACTKWNRCVKESIQLSSLFSHGKTASFWPLGWRKGLKKYCPGYSDYKPRLNLKCENMLFLENSTMFNESMSSNTVCPLKVHSHQSKS